MDSFLLVINTDNNFNHEVLHYIGGIMSVEDRVKKIIIDQLGVSADEVKSEASFVDDLGADSLDLTELIMAMEEEFDLEIDDEEAQKLLKVKDAVDYVSSKQ